MEDFSYSTYQASCVVVQGIWASIIAILASVPIILAIK